MRAEQGDAVGAPVGEARWFRGGEPVTIGGFLVKAGMIYVGRRLSAARVPGNDHCLIDPSLPVAKGNPDRAGETMPYWPSYAAIDPRARLAYLQWLAAGRSDPSIGIGHVFLFFYGLERRLFVDRTVGEAADLIDEVKRLLSIYGDNRSFDGYARRFLDVASLLVTPASSLESAPHLEPRWHSEMPLSIRAGIGRLIHEGSPVPAEWMLAWYLGHPDTRLRTPAKRAFAEFTQLFRARFEAACPGGTVIAPPKRKLRCSYEAASGAFTAAVTGEFNQWPDIAELEKPLARAAEIVEACTEALEPYSRLLGRDPNARGTLEAIRLLPAEIAQTADSQPLEALRTWLASATPNDVAAVDADELFERLGVIGDDGQRPSRSAYMAACELLARLNFGVEPDPRFGGHMPRPGDAAVLFRAPTGAPIDPAKGSYGATLALLGLGALLVHSDGTVTEPEERHLLDHLEDAFDLSEAERLRLRAHLLLLMRTAPKQAAVRKRLVSLQPEPRRSVARFAIAVAGADGRIAPEEVRLLERVYGMLDLDRKALYSDIHALGGPSDEPVTVRPAEPSSGVAVPRPPQGSPSPAIRLDAERLKRIREETAKVSGLLSEIFIEEPEPAMVASPSRESADRSRFDGLDARHGALLEALLQRGSLPRTEFERVAHRQELLPDGALGTINDWAIERFGELAIEEGDEITISAEFAGREGALLS